MFSTCIYRRTMGAPFKPLAGLIDPFIGSIDTPLVKNTQPQYIPSALSISKLTPVNSITPSAESIKNTYLENIFIYIAIILCIGILACALYWICNKSIFYSLVTVFVFILFYNLFYITILNTNDDSIMITRIHYTAHTLIFILSILMLLIVIRNKRSFA